MARWTFHNPVEIRFGEGRIDEIGAILQGRRYALITHSNDVLAPWIARIRRRCGPPVLMLDDVGSHPSLATLCGLAARLEQYATQPELIVAIGGGSVIDSAKFIAAGRGPREDVTRHLQEGAPLGELADALPIIAIPTTSGTGSDLTKWATVWDTRNGRKLSLEHDRLYPRVSIVDPLLTGTLPWKPTLASGLDALSHALESIWNRHANPISTGLAASAAGDILEALPQLQADLHSRPARARMAAGATAAGLAFSATRTALAHNISYPVTIEQGVPHGIACSFCLPEVMACATGANAACDQALASIFGDLPAAPARLRAWLEALDVPSHPGQLGIGADRWRDIVRDAFSGVRGRNFIGSPGRFPLPMVAASRAARA